jgi:hypothetical protein
MSNWKKGKGYADGGEIQSDAEEMPGIRLGQNANISDDTRARAMAQAARADRGKDPEMDSKPARASKRAAAPSKATDTGDESSRLSRRAPARGMANDDDASIPKAEYDATERPRSRASRFMDDLGENASKAFQATVGGAVAAKGVKAGVGALRRAYQGAKQGDDIMAAGAKRARAARDRVNDLRYYEGGMKDGGMVCSPQDYGKRR